MCRKGATEALGEWWPPPTERVSPIRAARHLLTRLALSGHGFDTTTTVSRSAKPSFIR